MTAAVRGRYPLGLLVGLLAAVLVLTGALAFGSVTWWHVRGLGLPLSHADALGEWLFVLLFVVPPTVALAAWLMIWLVARPLDVLARDAQAVRGFRFDGPLRRSALREVDALARALHDMRDTIRQFLDISSRLAGEHSFASLLDSVVSETLAATRMRAAAIYLRQPDGHLRPAAWLDAEARAALPAPRELPAGLDDDHPLLVATRDKRRHASLLSPALPPQGLEWLVAWFPGRGVNLLAVPLTSRPGDIVGVLCLASPGEEGGFATDLEAFVDALSGVAAVAIDQQHLMEERRRLFDAFVRVVAGTTDARSPYTGAHCQRVPVLAEMLAEAAAVAGMVPFADDDQRETLRLAAWLHDCGKLALPDFVVDKPTKLTCVGDRIHEIRTRFEVLKRDAELAYWRDLHGGGDEALLRQRLGQAWRELDEDFAFVASCNEGGEALPLDAATRLERIGERVWMRTLDDRLGIARAELERKRQVPPRPLPAREHLLADRLEHLVDWLPGEPLARTSPDAKLRVPPHKLNLGERYNLAIAHGTLTPEERYLIDAHADRTLAMLRELPWPRRLAQVPEIAGAHHERIDGTGYPRGLRGEQIGVPGRILAVADVFEALSARDRPYKGGRSTADVLGTMADMVRDGHLDREVFGILLGGVWRQYAERYLAPQQLDDIDVPTLMRRAGAT